MEATVVVEAVVVPLRASMMRQRARYSSSVVGGASMLRGLFDRFPFAQAELFLKGVIRFSWGNLGELSASRAISIESRKIVPNLKQRKTEMCDRSRQLS